MFRLHKVIFNQTPVSAMRKVFKFSSKSLIVFLIASLGCTDQFSTGNEDVAVMPSTLSSNSGLSVSTLPALPPPTNANFTEFNSLTSSQVSNIFANTDQFAIKYGTDNLYFNYERLIRGQLSAMGTEFDATFDISQIANQIDLNNLPAVDFGTYVEVSDLALADSVFTPGQLSIMDTFFAAVSTANGPTSALGSYNYAIYQINRSTISNEEKVVVRAIIETSYQFAASVLSGNWTSIEGDLETATASSASGCTINWRGIWGAAVVSGVVGAYFGAKTGAAGGTVVFPGLGTASGALGGGVIGFATGFLGGGALSAAEQLLLSCFRSVKQSQNMVLYCEQLPAYLQDPIHCGIEQQDMKTIYKFLQ